MANSPIELNYIFIRNRKPNYEMNNYYSYYGNKYLSDSFDDSAYQLTGYDVGDAIAGLLTSSPTFVEMFYSPIVYRDQENFKFGDAVLTSLDKQPELQQQITLLAKYRERLRSSFDSITEKQNEAWLSRYLEAIRDAARIEWLTLNYFSKTTDRPKPVHLIESDTQTVLGELKGHLDENLYKSIEKLRQLGGKKKRFDSVGRDKVVDEWLVATFKKSYDTYLQAVDSTATALLMPMPLDEELKGILNQSVKTKFEKFKALP